ncbi:MAG TPA: Hpt domain-containing protein, partial [Solimonas sp.]|nr:Hpt domain-containing protein [Solimonas sp.]
MSMLELFRMEAEGQVQALTAGLLTLERNPVAAEELEACMRAAHSLKGSARIVGIAAGVAVAHAMEDCFVAAQRGELRLRRGQIDLLLRGVDLLNRIAATPEPQLPEWSGARQPEIDGFLAQLAAALQAPADAEEPIPAPPSVEPLVAEAPAAAEPREGGERVLRVSADNLNRLLGVAGETLVESRWLKPFAESLLRLKRLHYEAGKALDRLHEALPKPALDHRSEAALADLQHRVHEFRSLLSQRLVELEMYDRRSTNLAHRLYEQALACRMRPFADGLHPFPRMVRDVAHTLGKQARLELVGESTRVDRDILEKLDAPLGHLLRNAVDHGIGTPQERLAAGKPAEGVVQLEARHSAGMLQIVVADDGRGVDLERLRDKVVQRGLAKAETAAQLSEAELLEFLFLPGFTMKDSVTEISGRGVGLDVVQNMIKQVRGA